MNSLIGVALKEWAVVCELMLEGRLSLLLRKGGIRESGGPGAFELEQRCFALFPSWAHQDPSRVRLPYRSRVRVLDEPDEVVIAGLGEAVRIWQVQSHRSLDSLEDLHPWSESQIDMRFRYRPERPLYLLAVRTSRLARPAAVPNRAVYKGCRSWVKLEPADVVDDGGGRAVLNEAAFEKIVTRVDAAMRDEQ